MHPRYHFGEPLRPLRELLGRGGILAIPTESSYALGVDPRNRVGVQAVYALKSREGEKPLPIIAASRRQILALGVRLAELDRAGWTARWPAPLSLVAPLVGDLPAAAGRSDLAVRIPAHAALRRLLAAVGPLTATSANRSGEPPVVDPAELDALLAGTDAMVVDAGVLPGGPPSTLITLQGGESIVLRYGAMPVREFSSGAVEKAAESTSI